MNDYFYKNIDVIIIGAGFYGCFTALTLKEKFRNLKIVIVEKESKIMQKASKNNQARVHAGYFYPKNIRTACKFLLYAPKFIVEFRDAIVDKFINVYAISKSNSKVNAEQFFNNYRKIKAKIEDVSSDTFKIFDRNLIEKSFLL